MFLHLSVILFTEEGGWLLRMHHRSHDQGVCIQGGLPPAGSATVGIDRPPVLAGGGWADPPEDTEILQDTVNKRVVRILLECILVFTKIISDDPR